MAKGLNCPNCGAPITGKVCEYCGTVFNAEETFGTIKKDGYFVELNLDGEVIKTYISSAEIINNRIYAEAGRRMDGTLLRGEPITKRRIKFELVEV